MPRSPIRRRIRQLADSQNGLTTAEYAVGTIAVVGLAALLLRLVTSEWMAGLLRGVVEFAFSSVVG